jgi:hypothetical protein
MSKIKAKLLTDEYKDFEEYGAPKDKDYKVVGTFLEIEKQPVHCIVTGYKRALREKALFERAFIGLKKVEIFNN